MLSKDNFQMEFDEDKILHKDVLIKLAWNYDINFDYNQVTGKINSIWESIIENVVHN